MTLENGQSRQISDQELDAALNRAIWALDLAKAMGDVREGNYERWERVAAQLRARYPKP
jgi:hypothetical protein